MTPEEKAVIKAALDYVKYYSGAEYSSLHAAVQALKVSRQSEQVIKEMPCLTPSSSGVMHCELPKGHDPDAEMRRRHQGRAADGSQRGWWEWLR